jgi:hypothetical protein
MRSPLRVALIIIALLAFGSGCIFYALSVFPVPLRLQYFGGPTIDLKSTSKPPMSSQIVGHWDEIVNHDAMLLNNYLYLSPKFSKMHGGLLQFSSDGSGWLHEPAKKVTKITWRLYDEKVHLTVENSGELADFFISENSLYFLITVDGDDIIRVWQKRFEVEISK